MTRGDRPTRQSNQLATGEKPLRLWPGVMLVILTLLLRFVLPQVVPEAGAISALGSLLGCVLFVFWWLLLSRAGWGERLGGLTAMVLALLGARALADHSFTSAGMGMTYFIYALPVLCTAFMVWAWWSRRLVGSWPRALSMIGVVALACGIWLPLRTAGMSGDGVQDFKWRWSESPEDRLLAAGSVDEVAPSAQIDDGVVRWPGFRGASRNAVTTGARIATDWTVSPPAELWRRPIGPGWSSFAVAGERVYTQEQRGEVEAVSCYSGETGELIWRHTDAARFWETHAGAGPRATPTLQDGVLYSFGATGILNALDAADGAVLWSRDATEDTGAAVPDWGFSASPLVVGDLVVVHAGALAAFDRATGASRWVGEDYGSYSSPHLATIDGVEQILMLGGDGAVSVAVGDGSLLWKHPWSGGIVQPALTGDGDVLVAGNGTTGGLGVRRVAVSRADQIGAGAELQGAGGWVAEEVWTSRGLKPNFSDFVVHEGHAYGFDNRILASIDLATGERNWKGGRYGSGQLILLGRQDLLLVVSEKGGLALVRAAPEGFDEVSRIDALTGKTWNHPVLVDDLLLLRNGEEMVAYRMDGASS